jgi:hypothetical protein
MSAIIPIRFFLDVQVNGKSMTVKGHGHGDPFAGSYDLHLTATPAFPPGFAVAGPNSCQMPLRLFFAHPEGDAPSFADLTDFQYRVDPEGRAVVSNPADEAVGDLRGRGQTRYADGVLVSKQQLCGTLDTAWLETVTHVDVPYDDILDPFGPGRATGRAQCQLRGSKEPLGCTATVPYRWDGDALPERLVCTVMEQRVDWDGRPDAHVHVRSALRTASAAQMPARAHADVR